MIYICKHLMMFVINYQNLILYLQYFNLMELIELVILIVAIEKG